MRRTLASVALLLASGGELAAQGKGIRFWNLTTATISSFQLSPAGKDTWGPNQTLNDKDKEVDHEPFPVFSFPPPARIPGGLTRR